MNPKTKHATCAESRAESGNSVLVSDTGLSFTQCRVSDGPALLFHHFYALGKEPAP